MWLVISCDFVDRVLRFMVCGGARTVIYDVGVIIHQGCHRFEHVSGVSEGLVLAKKVLAIRLIDGTRSEMVFTYRRRRPSFPWPNGFAEQQSNSPNMPGR